jgi:23S rRNA (uracil1939-C5)-methyltransferase
MSRGGRRSVNATDRQLASSGREEALLITHLGSDGDGFAELEGRPVYVPFTLPGEKVRAEIIGSRGVLTQVLAASSNRVPPVCPHFGRCGGCALQHLRGDAYLSFKRDLVVTALRARGLDAAVEPVIAIAPGKRRRVTLTAARSAEGLKLGFNQRHSTSVVPIEQCPVITPALVGVLPSARRLAESVLADRQRIKMVLTETLQGVDVDISGGHVGPDPRHRQALATFLDAGFARISIDHEPVAAKGPIEVLISGFRIGFPPGAFLQATGEAEGHIVRLVHAAIGKAKRVADLFAGIGTFALPVARQSRVLAIDSAADALSALAKAAAQPGVKPVETLRRDLFREPLSPLELEELDAVILDPPYAGAKAQCEQLAHARVPTVVMVSCNPATFARDARALCDGGFRLNRVTPIDQFVFSSDVEVVGEFARH